jgi:hypothetical protein
VPERPKGTGCKPVGSAYGGSNPPAPIIGGTTGRRPVVQVQRWTSSPGRARARPLGTTAADTGEKIRA